MSKEKNNNNNNQNNKSNRPLYWIIIALIIIIIILLLRSCGTGNTDISNPVVNPSKDPVIESPIGDFEVSDKQQNTESEKPVVSDNKTITFAGYGKYNVSDDKPNVELENPKNNFVDMVFTLTDKASGEIIARTGKVKAGDFVYVDIMKFYKETGTYTVVITTSTYDSETGVQMNGMNQEMEVIVK